MYDAPTLVFIPGAWHQPNCYDKIIKLLEEQHHLKCVAITLPSTTGDPNITFKDDYDAARNAITHETTAGRDVVVLAHSYGGLVGNSAIKGLTLPQPNTPLSTATTTSSPTTKSNPTHGHVTGLILLASGFSFTGLTFMAPLFNIPPPFFRVNRTTGFAELTYPPTQFFYHDLPPPEASYWTSQLRPQSLRSLFEGAEYAYAGWRDLPARGRGGVWYVGTVEDQGLPVVVQRMQVGMVRAMGVGAEHREVRASHSLFLSRPEETVRVVAEAVGVFRGGRLTGADVDGKVVVAPGARLWAPGTWFRFGLPLALGHVIGKCVLVFMWGRRLLMGGR
ncbi:Alpha/beta hydrolase family-domain-containing protein [Chaetomium tenue]|uniref:Alpha/beta hydrolase family-domain-containing protein n=1 Tax=Chaetomium tenue TaxID=1854479 RepID=A0ACB7PJH7_9PEZI|nr:Alpha/beta hydrolase family-domain-containing protein [Chaetomium globosum]